MCLADLLWLASDDKWIGVGVMNKRTRAIDEDTSTYIRRFTQRLWYNEFIAWTVSQVKYIMKW